MKSQNSPQTAFFIVLIASFFLLNACATNQPASTTTPQTLTVFAAASLTDAFNELGKQFEIANSNVTVAFNFAGSQSLRTQLEQGANADIFASASGKEMQAAITASLIATDSVQILAKNQLIVILPANNPAGIKWLNDLAKPNLKLVLAAEEVPAGQYARQVLENLSKNLGKDFKTAVLSNVVSNETNVRQVVTKVHLGEADAGIVYASDAVAEPTLKTILIPAEANVVATYPIATLKKSANIELANAFVLYALSPSGQAVLKKWGFTASAANQTNSPP